MRRIKDPFPPTPERFHLRVEETLLSLEESSMKHDRFYRRGAALAAVLAALLLMATAVAAVVGVTPFKDRLDAEGAGEVADNVQEVHMGSAPDDSGFAFSVDEIIWEDRNLYVSYSLSVPEDGSYMVAMFTPTLNGEKLQYDAKGFTMPKFLDRDDGQPTVLLMGGDRKARCSELWTFSVDPRLKQRTDNRLAFRVVLLKSKADLPGGGDWDDMLDPPEYAVFSKDWLEWADDSIDPAAAQAMDRVAASIGRDGTLTLEDLVASGCAEYVTEKSLSMGLDASKLPETLYNDVTQHEFDRMGVHVRVDRFRMTHLGVELRYTCSVPGAKADDQDAIDRLNAFVDEHWRFCGVDGRPLGYSLGGTGGGGWSPLPDGTPAYELSWNESVLLSLEGMDEIAFAPCDYLDDPDGGNHPVYDMENAIALTPVYSEAVAEIDASATPEPTEQPWDDDEGGLSS